MPKAKPIDRDPGPIASAERGEAQAEAARHPIKVEKATVRIGTAGWTDPTMVEPGVFYPPDATNAEDRLRYYADQFPIVEVDANYGTTNAREIAAMLADQAS